MNIRLILVCSLGLGLACQGATAWGQSKGSNKKPAPPKNEPIKLPPAVLKTPTEKVMKVAPVDRGKRSQVEEAAAKIDALLEASWAKYEVPASPNLKDEQFLRRIYLELGGRIPTYFEAMNFIGSKTKEKRPELIDSMLESPDYVSHFYNYWADILRLCERPQPNVIMDPYLTYVKDCIRENKPYDKWVHEMLTAEGKIWENPAVGFQIRDDGMPLPYIDNTVRVFLGTQIGCAQCHDHPFDIWTQKQFYELAAYTSGTRTRLGGGDPEFKGGNPINQLIKDAQAKTPDGKVSGSLQQMIRANQFAVRYAKRDLKLPHDYAYSDAKPNQVVKAKVLWGEIPATAEKATPREQFAAWIAGRSNRQFARNIANRMWQKMMGVGIVEPVDDFRKNNPPTNPELLEHLTDEVIRLNYDVRELVRVIAYTKAYQKQATVYDASEGKPYRFPSPTLRRMTAEQLWDSLLTLVAYNPWSYQRPSAQEIAKTVNIDLANAKLDEVEKVHAEYAETYFPGKYNANIQKLCGFKGQLLVRASEIPTPVPLGHFLRQFGQSDRQAIEASSTAATIPQILTMFNGPITHILLEKGSVIYDNVVMAGPSKAVDVIFVTILSHRPNSTDRELAQTEIKNAERPEAGYGNVIWALLNTREFIFIQ